MPDNDALYDVRERTKNPEHASVDNVVELVLERAQHPRTEHRDAHLDEMIHAVLQGPQIVPTPRLIVDYARNGHMSHEQAQTLITTISSHRSWENSPYVTQLLQRLDE